MVSVDNFEDIHDFRFVTRLFYWFEAIIYLIYIVQNPEKLKYERYKEITFS